MSQQLGALQTHTTDTFLFISHTTNVLLFKFRCNIINAGFGSEWDTLYNVTVGLYRIFVFQDSSEISIPFTQLLLHFFLWFTTVHILYNIIAIIRVCYSIFS